MPAPDQILTGLQDLATTWRTLAVVWHVLFLGLAVILVFGSRPSRRVVGVFLSLPLLTAAILGFSAANPFNGILLTAAGVGLAAAAMTWEKEPVAFAPVGLLFLGAVLFAYGWVYPHFLEGASPYAWLYASPVGVVPCPTLAITIGMALMLGGLESRGFSGILGLAGVFYGVYGVARLHVALDWGLLLGAAVFLVVVFARAPRALREAHP